MIWQRILPYFIKDAGKVGSLGDYQFECSNKTIKTINNYQATCKARYATHNLINLKPRLEFLGSEPRELSFDIYLSTDLGIQPEVEKLRLTAMLNSGKVNHLTIGGEVIGRFVIESIDEKVDAFGRGGKIVASKVTLKLKEYCSD
ncbi:MAG: phage tail protein [Selenomonadaceae bacterium]|nr:phage tail protein [Selenomonadaceae bacterium]